MVCLASGASAVKEGAEAWGKRLGGPGRALGPAAAAKLRKRPVRKLTSFEGDWDLEGAPAWLPIRVQGLGFYGVRV